LASLQPLRAPTRFPPKKRFETFQWRRGEGEGDAQGTARPPAGIVATLSFFSTFKSLVTDVIISKDVPKAAYLAQLAFSSH